MINSFKNECRKILKYSFFTVLGNDPLLSMRLRRLSNSNLVTVLNLHRVSVDDGSDYKPLNPSIFDELLSFAKKNFSIITFSQLAEKSRKPKLILSFDDGYKDFYSIAIPIIAKHSLKVNQNLIPRCIETGLPPLNVMAQDFVGKAPKELVKRLKIDGFDVQLDNKLGQRLSCFLKMRSQVEQDKISNYLVPQFYDWCDFKPTPMMTLEEVMNLSDHELGAHSYSHSSMEYETNNFLEMDVKRCSTFFIEKIGVPMKIYAFPNGSYRPGQAEIVLKQGVRHVLLVGETFNNASNIHHRFTFDARNKSELRFKALGGITPI